MYTTGEVNLTAGDRPLRVRSAGVDEHLFRPWECKRPKADCSQTVRPSQQSAADTGPARAASPPPAIAILSHELWQSAFGGRPMIGEDVEVNGRRLQVLGIMPRGADLMDNRTEIWLPLGLNPANRQNRGNHFLYVIGRLKNGTSPQAANAELEGLMKNWGERVGVAFHTFGAPAIFFRWSRCRGRCWAARAAQSGCFRPPSASCC